MAEVHNEEANQGGRSTICSAPNPSIPRPILKPVPRNPGLIFLLLQIIIHLGENQIWRKKIGNGVFQDLWFRVLMPSLIFGQFAAKLENKIWFRPRSVGRWVRTWLGSSTKYRSFIRLKKWPMPPWSDWHLSACLAFDSWEKWTTSGYKWGLVKI